jgi:hypothetical protein
MQGRRDGGANLHECVVGGSIRTLLGLLARGRPLHSDHPIRGQSFTSQPQPGFILLLISAVRKRDRDD